MIVKVWEGVAYAMNRSPETGLVIFIVSHNVINRVFSIDSYYSTTAVGGYSENSTRAEFQFYYCTIFYLRTFCALSIHVATNTVYQL